MRVPARSRKLFVPVAIVAGAMLTLTSCNDFNRTLTPGPEGGFSAIGLIYEGPSGAWLDVKVGAGGAGIDVSTSVVLFQVEDAPRDCKDGVTGATEVCNVGEDGGPRFSDVVPTNGTFHTTMALENDDHVAVRVECRVAGEIVACPEDLELGVRSVNSAGELFGDLR